jgi:lipoprotein-anchoring transpeptidase ErfK/SrfK
MTRRVLAALIAFVAVFGLFAAAHAESSYEERQQMLNGGQLRGRGYNFLGFTGSDMSRTRVSYAGSERPGTIVVSTAERKLYLIQEGGTALRYAIGVGRVGFTWKGTHKISEKKEWPTWTPPAQMHARQRGLPKQMAGGVDNPLGARALYLGSTLYRIHGSNDPDSIGQAESSGCFRMTNDDVKDLYDRVAVGTTVIVR